MGEGDGVAMIGRETGGRANSFWRDTVPRRVVGRDPFGFPGYEKFGPGKWVQKRNHDLEGNLPANSPCKRFTSTSPSCSSLASSWGVQLKAVGDSGVVRGWPIEAKKSARGCFDCERTKGFSLSVADTVRHKSGSCILRRRKARENSLSHYLFT